MSDEVLQLYVLEQLKSFYSGNRCCMKFLAQLFRIDPRYFVKTVKDFGLRMRSDLDESVIVFKDTCHHSMEAMDLRLCQESVKDMYMFHRESEFCGSHQEFQASPDFLSPGNAPPTVPPHRFSLGPLKQSMARNNQQGQESFQATCAMQPYKDMILQGLSRSRVLVINGGTFCKSTAIPMYIIEKCSEERRHCKIICVEREQLVAIHNSECLAGHFHEKVGETVAYQVQLQSRISDSSNLVYTTSSFLLRVLMGQSTMDSFRHISHVVIVGAHQHEAFADLLLRELNVALRYHPYLKVILLSNYSRNYEFLEYFGEGEEINLDGSPHDMEKFEVVYLDDIHKVLTESRPSTTIARAFNSLPIALSSAKTAGININHLDRCLEAYERSSNDEHFNTFMYMVKGEAADINHRHSITGRTALNIASLLGKVDHVKTLLQLNADPLITDKFDVDALKAAFSMENLECFELLKVACFENTPRTADWRQEFVNHGLITDIIHMLTTKNDIWKRG